MRPLTYSRCRPKLAAPSRVKYPDFKIPMREVAARYGIEVDQHGRCLCPFHNDHTPSMTLYEGSRGWYCWVCAEGGDAIDFVKKLFGLSSAKAAQKLCEDFGLCAPAGGLCKSEYLLRAEEENRILGAFRREYDNRVAERRECVALARGFVPTEQTAGAYGALLGRLEYLDYWFEQNPWR